MGASRANGLGLLAFLGCVGGPTRAHAANERPLLGRVDVGPARVVRVGPAPATALRVALDATTYPDGTFWIRKGGVTLTTFGAESPAAKAGIARRAEIMTTDAHGAPQFGTKIYFQSGRIETYQGALPPDVSEPIARTFGELPRAPDDD
jgi:hypothetical protein